jgi:predicted Zn-dependent protease
MPAPDFSIIPPRLAAAPSAGLFLLVIAVFYLPATAADFARDSIPAKWYEPLTPEGLPPLVYPKYFNNLDKARLQADSGRYKLALQTLRTAAGDSQSIALIKSQALRNLGRLDEALAVLSTNQPKIQLARIGILYDLGRGADAIAELKIYLQAHPDSLPAHYELGRISEATGDLETARSAFGWFVDAPQSYLDKWKAQHEKLFDSAADATTVGKALDRWATLNGQYQKDDSLNDTILDFFVKSYDVIDRAYWPAHVAAAEYFLSHDDAESAKKELHSALLANPNDAKSLEIIGRIALLDFNFDTADAAVDAIRKSNPTSIDADLLEIDDLLRQRRPKEAGALARSVLDRRPYQLEAMSLLAASEALQLHDDQTKALLADADRADPHGATAYFEVAEQLAAMRQYPRSAAMYKIAIDRAPWWTAPLNGLGLLYTQSGDEDLARSTLDAAHALDPFNIITTNYLRLLDQLASFGRKESAHFIVCYDAQLDPLIPEYYTDYLESIYPQVTGDFKTEPPQKTIIEVFPTMDAFAVRTTGSPWIATVGASSGRIIAMVAPRKGENTQGAFNWSQVLRHEFTHTVTLAATDNRIPHWMTEGLAVEEEHAPLQWAWVPQLYDAVTKNQLFDLDQLTWAFIRPRRPADRQLAYAESFWVCTYIDQTYGHDAVLQMLAQLKNGVLQQDVFPKILNRTQAQLFAEFTDWAKKQIAGWGYDADTQQKYDELRASGEELIQDHHYGEAINVWQQIVALRPMDELPHQRLAGLYLAPDIHDATAAIEQLKILHRVDIKDDRYPKRISRLYRDAGDFSDAEQFALRAIYIDPYDLDAHQLLAEVADKAADAPAVAREQRVIPILEQWITDERDRAAIH